LKRKQKVKKKLQKNKTVKVLVAKLFSYYSEFALFIVFLLFLFMFLFIVGLRFLIAIL
jgi:hypothetical protein